MVGLKPLLAAMKRIFLFKFPKPRNGYVLCVVIDLSTKTNYTNLKRTALSSCHSLLFKSVSVDGGDLPLKLRLCPVHTFRFI